MKKSEAGFSLLETMMASAVFAILIGTVTVFLTQSNSQLSLKRARLEQARLVQAMKGDLRELKRIREAVATATAGNELLLRRCLFKNNADANDCTITDPNNQRPFIFNSRRAGAGSPFVKKGGTPASPASYSLYGAPNCTPGTPYCPFWNVETYFWASCPGGDPVCDQAATVSIRYIVKPAKPKYQGVPLKAIPDVNDFNANKGRFAITHQISDGQYKLGELQDCPQGSIMSGSEKNGKVKCICRGGWVNIEPDPYKPPKCIATSTTCLPGQRIKGRKPNGAVHCVNQVKQCKSVRFDKDDGDSKNTSDSATCPVGGWLENINLGRCKAAPKNKKGTDRGIKCDTNRGRCCWYDEI